MLTRVGFGFDVHEFEVGRRLILGGVDVPHSAGLKGHSDADVVIHAVVDALLGAAGLGDIGQHFPDSDSQFKDINSRKLLETYCRTVGRSRLEYFKHRHNGRCPSAKNSATLCNDAKKHCRRLEDFGGVG